ncbi:hypothetical protein Ahy_B09g098036 [Arachis hypogaea]|uniref:Protein FAR1-RELATED SEQUENCE n=1 Tax=Arachis hypogaea TaxID=3818 RepID=A0A444XQH7_ARAHY|nr:hypothetical protein Ahy_B09g098036 [Arachis hypogaea]
MGFMNENTTSQNSKNQTILVRVPSKNQKRLFLKSKFELILKIMDDSTSDCQLNQGEVDFEFESNEVPKLTCCRSGVDQESLGKFYSIFLFLTWCILQPLCVVDDQFVPKVGMTFTTLEDAGKFYKDYAKATGFSTRKSKISPIEKTNPTASLNCPARIYIHTLKDVGAWIISKVVLHHSHPCCPSKAEMLKQHRELSMSVRRTIENNEEAGIIWFVVLLYVDMNHQGGNAPKGILTDQCASMKRAIEACMPTTIYHWYIWHIMKKIPSKLNDMVLWTTSDFQVVLLKIYSRGVNCIFWVYYSFIWVYYADLYEDHHIWVPIYLDHHFWAGMRSTQRSESMHSFFNKFITRNNSLIQFVKQYDNCLGSREQAERESDATDFHTIIPCATKSSIEAQFQHVYTHQKFREVQAQFRGKANCITRLTNSALGYSVYEVGEQVCNSIFNKFVVTYDSVAAEVKCQCLLFDVLSFERVTQVSPRYIPEQWSKKVKRRHTHIKSSHGEPLLEPRSKRFDELVFRSQNICEFESELEELTAILHRAYDEVMVEMEELKAKRKGTCSLSHEDANLEFVNELQSPPRVRTRGCPKNRLGSKLDKQIANALKKKKTKALNELNLFDAASVVHPNSSQYQGCVMNYQFREPTAGDKSGKHILLYSGPPRPEV